MKIESSFNAYLCCPFILLDYKFFSFQGCLFFLFIKFYIRLSIMQNIKTLVCAETMNNRCWKSLVKSTHIHRNILLKRICIQVKNLITNLFVLQTSPGTFFSLQNDNYQQLGSRNCAIQSQGLQQGK